VFRVARSAYGADDSPVNRIVDSSDDLDGDRGGCRWSDRGASRGPALRRGRALRLSVGLRRVARAALAEPRQDWRSSARR